MPRTPATNQAPAGGIDAPAVFQRIVEERPDLATLSRVMTLLRGMSIDEISEVADLVEARQATLANSPTERGGWRAFMLVSEGDGRMQRYAWTIERGSAEAQTFADALATLETLAAEPED